MCGDRMKKKIIMFLSVVIVLIIVISALVVVFVLKDDSYKFIGLWSTKTSDCDEDGFGLYIEDEFYKNGTIRRVHKNCSNDNLVNKGYIENFWRFENGQLFLNQIPTEYKFSDDNEILELTYDGTKTFYSDGEKSSEESVKITTVLKKLS